MLRASRGGKLYFVGGGPGDPRWLTKKACELLSEAQVVAHDDLIHPQILELIHPEAELLSIGYRGYRSNRRMIVDPRIIDRLAAGFDVIRLKSGDPMLYGRTLEEIQVLEKNGTPWEIIPGITAASGAAASTRIPWTHRGLSSSVRIVAGNHVSPEHELQETIIVYMPKGKIADLCQKLIKAGRDPKQMAAYIQGVGSPLQRIAYGTLSSLPEVIEAFATDLPGLVIIGDVVSFGFNPGPSAQLPLSGKRILIGRSSLRQSSLRERLVELGADIMEAPRLQAVPLLSDHEVRRQIFSWNHRDLVVFSSSYAVNLIQRSLKESFFDLRQLGHFAIAVGDQQSHDRLRSMGIQSSYFLYDHREIRDAGGREFDRLILFGHQPTCDRMKNVLVKKYCIPIADLNEVTINAYELKPIPIRINAPKADLAVYPNMKSARLLLETLDHEEILEIPSVVLGPQTGNYLKSHEFRKILQSPHPDYDSLVEMILQWFHDTPTSPNDQATIGFHP